MDYLKEYKHKETWGRRGNNFYVEVVRWEIMSAEKFDEYKQKWGSDTGRFVWNVYCYLYPNHPLFNASEKEDMFDCPVNSFHGGSTFAEWYRKEDGTVSCKKYGCDYNHYQDEDFTHMESPNDAYEVFMDAENLFNELSKN